MGGMMKKKRDNACKTQCLICQMLYKCLLMVMVMTGGG